MVLRIVCKKSLDFDFKVHCALSLSLSVNGASLFLVRFSVIGMVSVFFERSERLNLLRIRLTRRNGNSSMRMSKSSTYRAFRH